MIRAEPFDKFDHAELRSDALTDVRGVGSMLAALLTNQLGKWAVYFNDTLILYAGVTKPVSFLGRPEFWLLPTKSFRSEHMRSARRLYREMTRSYWPMVACADPKFDRFTQLMGFKPIGKDSDGNMLYEVK